MTRFIEVRALAGMNYIRAEDVIAVQYVDPQKSTVMLAGGAALACSEPVKQIVSRIEAALQQPSETPDGDGSS